MMDFAAITALLSVCGVISGIIIGWSGRTRAVRLDTKEEARSDAMARADIEYIKRGIEDIKHEQRAQGKRFDELAERVTRLEESQKSMQKRVDHFEKAKGRV
ncbi:hypothetical protein [Paenibacillus albilobatus]|nr:hypothetical protein [Paenibacillus albilobatus]